MTVSCIGFSCKELTAADRIGSRKDGRVSQTVLVGTGAVSFSSRSLLFKLGAACAALNTEMGITVLA